MKKYAYEGAYVDRIYAYNNRQPDYCVLALRDVFTFDDVTEELVSGLALFGYDGFKYWAQACKSLTEDETWPTVTSDTPKKEDELAPYYTATGSVEYVPELPDEDNVRQGKQYEVRATERKVAACIECSFTSDDVTLRTDRSTFDYTALDSTPRTNIAAQDLRSDIGVLGLEILTEVEEQCAEGRSLAYGNTCSCVPMYAQDTVFDVDRTSSDASFHFHFRSSTGTIVRELEWYNNHILTYGARPCVN